MAQTSKNMQPTNNNESGRQFDQDTERRNPREQDSSSERSLNRSSEKSDSTLKAPHRDPEGNR